MVVLSIVNFQLRFRTDFFFVISILRRGGNLAYDAIGVLSMLTSINGSGSGDPELRRVCRERGGGYFGIICPVSWLIIHIFIYV